MQNYYFKSQKNEKVDFNILNDISNNNRPLFDRINALVKTNLSIYEKLLSNKNIFDKVIDDDKLLDEIIKNETILNKLNEDSLMVGLAHIYKSGSHSPICSDIDTSMFSMESTMIVFEEYTKEKIIEFIVSEKYTICKDCEKAIKDVK